jgi:hypothetical protein
MSAHRGVFFIGAMPWVRLFDGQQLTCWASVIHADWSLHGPGRLIILRQNGRRRILGTNKGMLDWLEQWLLRPEGNEKSSAARDDFEQRDVELEINPEVGMKAAAGDIQVEINGALDRQLIRRERYPLGDFFPTASWVRIACMQARVIVDGKSIPGNPNLSTDSFGRFSTAQINIAEVWTT